MPDEPRQETGHDDYDDLHPLFARLATNPDDADAVRAEIVERALPLAEHIARRFRGRGEQYDDLLQVARVGLVNAVDRFDVARGTDFVSFAVPTIMGEVRHHFRDTGWAMRVPRRLKDLHMEITRCVALLSQDRGRAPSAKEIAAELGIGVDEVLEGLIAGGAYQTVSMDTPVRDDGADVPLVETLGDDDESFEIAEGFADLQPALARLPERERTIVLLRFFGGLTQSEIAERLGISQMHVSRLLSRTLTALRDELT
ncbi:SigB/SigF/SigG family RNA polymerase sigma factor [Rhodococcus gannanensis]|uniref:SigB/SigF/SigG family RNA polymerase sigma factor n=1 Tax=Rhodococcus gannanensis TaxID=1960308 RepID=A0ABW4P5G5_9NOCA